MLAATLNIHMELRFRRVAILGSLKLDYSKSSFTLIHTYVVLKLLALSTKLSEELSPPNTRN